MLLIISLLWISFSIGMIFDLTEYIRKLNALEQVAVLIILILGAPILYLSSGIVSLLDQFLEEGWDNDDDDKFGY